jgi:hypothetical protein
VGPARGASRNTQAHARHNEASQKPPTTDVRHRRHDAILDTNTHSRGSRAATYNVITGPPRPPQRGTCSGAAPCCLGAGRPTTTDASAETAAPSRLAERLLTPNRVHVAPPAGLRPQRQCRRGLAGPRDRIRRSAGAKRTSPMATRRSRRSGAPGAVPEDRDRPPRCAWVSALARLPLSERSSVATTALAAHRDRVAPAPAVWSTAPTLLLLCLRPARSWLTAIRCRIAVAKQHSSDAMRARLLAFRPPTTEHVRRLLLRQANPQARGRRGRACRLPPNLPATRSRRRSHEGDAPPGSRARLASKPDPDHHRTSTRTAVHPSSSSSLPRGVILPGPATQARNERSAAALAPTDQVSNEWVCRSVERHRAQIREHPGFVVSTLRGTCTITDVFVRT